MLWDIYETSIIISITLEDFFSFMLRLIYLLIEKPPLSIFI